MSARLPALIPASTGFTFLTVGVGVLELLRKQSGEARSRGCRLYSPSWMEGEACTSDLSGRGAAEMGNVM